MQESNANNLLKPELIIEMVLRRRWWIILPVILSLCVGIVLAFKLPKSYKASTTILVQPQRVPEDYVRSIVADSIQSRINTITHQILSRTNLESVIRKFDLVRIDDTSGARLEAAVNGLRSKIGINVSRNRRASSAFTISYEGSDPEKVRDITNALASSFIDENLKIRETQALGTSDFLESELTAMRKLLEEKEKKLREFRFQYIGELPNQLDANLRIIDRLQANRNEKEKVLRDLRDRLQRLREDANADGENPTTLEGMQAALDGLLLKYTDKHPDVIRLKNQIKEFEVQMKNPDSVTGRTLAASLPNRRVLREMEAIEKNIREAETEIALTQAKIRDYEARVEATPKHEQELLAIQRDYQNIQKSYSSLLNRKLEAEIAVNMERKQKGEQFRIIDPARLPTHPSSPDMRKLFLLFAGVGFAIGGGIVILLEFMNPSFRLPEDIEKQLGVQVLATIPIIQDGKTVLLKRANHVLTVSALMVATALLLTFAAIALLGMKPGL